MAKKTMYAVSPAKIVMSSGTISINPYLNETKSEHGLRGMCESENMSAEVRL